MEVVKYKENIIKFSIYTIVLLLVLLVVSKVFYKETPKVVYNDITTSVIEYKDDNTNIYVEYPRFYTNEEINTVVNEVLLNYIKAFREKENNSILDVSYELKYLLNYVNIEFHIEDSTTSVKNMNILFNLENNDRSYFSNMFEKDKLINEINTIFYNDYSLDMYNKILDQDIDEYTYIVNEEDIEVYFNNIDFTDCEIDYIPKIKISLVTPKNEEENDPNTKKYVAFTYDDGPNEYTKEITNYLDETSSNATFFMYGYKMKNNDDIILNITALGSEVGIHGYNATNFLTLSRDERKNEIDAANDVFYEISGKKTMIFRPMYGKYDADMRNLGYKLVLWNVDSRDWLVKDTNKIVTNVLNGVSDGSIVLLHDKYKETMEATKILIPELNKMGYEVVSVSKLMEIKKYKNKNEAISYIK